MSQKITAPPFRRPLCWRPGAYAPSLPTPATGIDVELSGVNECILNVTLTGPLSNVDNFFFVADTYLRNVYQVDAIFGTTSQLLPFGTATNPLALAYDSTNKLLYWTDVNAHTINRYSLITNISTVIYRDARGIGKDFRFTLYFLLQHGRLACNAERCISHGNSVCLSVLLSVTRWYCTQTNEDRIIRSSRWGSKNTLVFWYQQWLGATSTST